MFKIEITEIRKRNVYIDEDFDFNAECKVKEQHRIGEITLDREHIIEVTYNVEEI